MSILTTAAVASLLDCEESTVQARATSGDLPGVKVGRSWVFPEAALLERLNDMAREGAALRRMPSTVAAVAGQMPVAPPAGRGRRSVLPACLTQGASA